MHIFAYLDPGSVSAALAAVLAGIAGIGAAFRTFGHSLKSKLMFWKKDELATEAAGEAAVTTAKVEETAGKSATAAKAEASEDKPAEQ